MLDKEPSDLPVHCSSVLSFLSEYRCYVLNDAVHIVCYSGDEHAAPADATKVREAVEALRASGQGSAAYALDVGVALVDGRLQTVLIEVNDGYALGLYPGCDPEWYAQMMVARWDEIVAARTGPLPP